MKAAMGVHKILKSIDVLSIVDDRELGPKDDGLTEVMHHQ